MELNELVKKLVESGVVENEELGLTLMGTDEMDPEEKEKQIILFIKRYLDNPQSYLTEEKRELFKQWMDLYVKTLPNYIKKQRVKKI